MNNFWSNLDKGSKAEDFLSDFLEEMFSWKFIAGNKNGKVVNSEYIEKVFNCKYLQEGKYEDGYHGARLQFSNGDIAIMPDLLFLSSHDETFWVESKASFNHLYKSIDIEVNKVNSYLTIQKHCGRTVWLVLTIVNKKEKTCRIYSVSMKRLNKYITINNVKETKNSFSSLVYRIPVNSNLFNSLTQSDIKYG